jgi:hypothetical protein
VRVERTLQPARNTPATFNVPKTDRSRRVLDIGPSVVLTLSEHKVRQNAERLTAGAVWQDMGLVFSNTIGGPIDGAMLLRRESLTTLTCRVSASSICGTRLRHFSWARAMT